MLISGTVIPSMPPLEREKPSQQEETTLRMETFQFNIDQQGFDCSAGELKTGNKAPHAYRSSTDTFETELQIHAARCKTHF